MKVIPMIDDIRSFYSSNVNTMSSLWSVTKCQSPNNLLMRAIHYCEWVMWKQIGHISLFAIVSLTETIGLTAWSNQQENKHDCIGNVACVMYSLDFLSQWFNGEFTYGNDKNYIHLSPSMYLPIKHLLNSTTVDQPIE
jgi:hypothetical protein